MADETRQYLVILQLGNTDPARLQDAVPWIKGSLERISSEPIESAFRSVTADIFGFLLRSRLAAKQIEAALLRPNLKRDAEGFQPSGELDNNDHVFVLEVGEDFASSSGFSRARTWLEHH